jgi:hypothetical protein
MRQVSSIYPVQPESAAEALVGVADLRSASPEFNGLSVETADSSVGRTDIYRGRDGIENKLVKGQQPVIGGRRRLEGFNNAHDPT